MSKLRDDEQQLVNESERCWGCGHLDLFHSTYYKGRDEDYQRCKVPSCTCRRIRCAVMDAPDKFLPVPS
jgi:hypothetical protein